MQANAMEGIRQYPYLRQYEMLKNNEPTMNQYVPNRDLKKQVFRISMNEVIFPPAFW